MATLDRNHPIPLYHQLKNVLENRIESGEYQPGVKIPSEHAICMEFDVSRTTARLAVGELESDGLITRSQGRGTYVTENTISQVPYTLNGFSGHMKSQNLIPGSIVLELKLIMPDQEIATRLKIELHEAVIFLNRVRTLAKMPVALEYSYMPFKRFEGLLEIDFDKTSLYDTLVRQYNTTPTRTQITFEAISPTSEIQEHLKTSDTLPILYVTDVVYDQNNKLIQFNRIYYRGDRYAFSTDINRFNNENVLQLKK